MDYAIPTITQYNECLLCGKQTILICCQCRVASYCGKDCQRKDWISHKVICQSPPIKSRL